MVINRCQCQVKIDIFYENFSTVVFWLQEFFSNFSNGRVSCRDSFMIINLTNRTKNCHSGMCFLWVKVILKTVRILGIWKLLKLLLRIPQEILSLVHKWKFHWSVQNTLLHVQRLSIHIRGCWNAVVIYPPKSACPVWFPCGWHNWNHPNKKKIKNNKTQQATESNVDLDGRMWLVDKERVSTLLIRLWGSVTHTLIQDSGDVAMHANTCRYYMSLWLIWMKHGSTL